MGAIGDYVGWVGIMTNDFKKSTIYKAWVMIQEKISVVIIDFF